VKYYTSQGGRVRGLSRRAQTSLNLKAGGNQRNLKKEGGGKKKKEKDRAKNR